MAAYRLMRNDPLKRIRYDKLRQQFPELLERDFRLRLKEFAQLQKKGTNDGWWKLKPSSITDERSLLQLVTPEQVQHLKNHIIIIFNFVDVIFVMYM